MTTTTKKRRYASGEHATYDNTYNMLRVNSWILNAGNREKNFERVFDLQSKQTTKAVFDDLAKSIALVQAELRSIDNAFKFYTKNRIAAGYPRPETLPDDLREKQLKIEAYLDLYVAELGYLKEILKKFDDAEREKRNELMLKHGPRQSGRLEHGVLVEIDGQRVGKINGVLCITEPDSPYHGMSIADYRAMALVWCRVYDQTRYAREEARTQEIRATGSSNIPYTNLNAYVPRSALPAWPSGVKNHAETKK